VCVGDHSVYDDGDDDGEWSGGSGRDEDSRHRYNHMLSPVAVDHQNIGRHFVDPSVPLPSHSLSTHHPVMYTATSVASPVVYTTGGNYVSSAALLSSECLLVVVIAAAVCSFIAVHHCLSLCTVT